MRFINAKLIKSSAKAHTKENQNIEENLCKNLLNQSFFNKFLKHLRG
jgi:hypothetical protein